MISHTIIACAIVGAGNDRKQENHCTLPFRMSCNTPFVAHVIITVIAHIIIACVTVGACAATHSALAHELHAMSVLQYCMQYTCNECVAVLHAMWMQWVCCSTACNVHQLLQWVCWVLHAMTYMRISCVQSPAWLHHKDRLSHDYIIRIDSLCNPLQHQSLWLSLPLSLFLSFSLVLFSMMW